MAIFSRSKKFIFVHVPKCGGTSIEAEWQRHADPTDLVIRFSNAEQLMPRFGLTMHATLQQFLATPRLGDVATFETCALVRSPLKIVESFYKYGLKNLDMAVRSGMTHAPQLGRSYDGWVSYVRDKLANDATDAPGFVAGLNGGVVREAMLSRSFDEFLERVGDDRWERFMRRYTSFGDKDVAVRTILKLEDPIAIRKYFKVRFHSGFTLIHANDSGVATPTVWSKPMRQRYNTLTEAEHLAFGYQIVD